MFKLSYIIIFLLLHSSVYAFEKQDCEVMEYESGSITLGFKAGDLFWGVGPEVTFGSQSGVVWGDNLQYMVAEYQELCSRYNTGRISQSEYDKEIQLIIQRSRDFTFKMNEMFRVKKETLFNEMEKEILK
ncbi:MAG: hypothetical protein H8E74_10530 [Gammaproteobacteria bacterium]|nr:hypothetical protein [Gammaproteobacteria bacterium]